MSFSGHGARAFFGPLAGKTTTFLLEGREANMHFARATMALLAGEDDPCAVLDLDAFYSSNADSVLTPLGSSSASAAVIVPEPGSDVEAELSAFITSRQKVLVIDSMNTLYHMISVGDGSSRGRKIAFAVAALSYLARTNGKAVLITMYRREGFFRSGTARSISGLSDVTASVEVGGGEVIFRCTRGQAWPGGRYSSRIP